MSLGEVEPPLVNAALRMATPEGGEYLYVIDVAPDDVMAEYKRVDEKGLMLLDDRRGGFVWTVWASTIMGFDATEAQPNPLPAR
jgi:hypothetical protein